MKTLYILVILSAWVATTTLAQPYPAADDPPHRKSSFAGIGVYLSPHASRYPRMSFDGLMSLSRNAPLIGQHLSDHQPQRGTVATMMTGATLGLYTRWFPYRTRFTGQHELRLGAGVVIGREAVIDYQWEDPTSARDAFGNSQGHHYVDYCLMESELQLSASYLFHVRPDRRFQWYGGPAVNASTTFNSLLFIISSSESDLERGRVGARNAMYTRLLGHGGVSYRFGKHVTLTAEGQWGVGWQWLPGRHSNFLSGYHALLLGVQYQIW